jgi:hypothetical protein
MRGRWQAAVGWQGWTTLPADPARAERVLSAAGVVTVVAVEDREVIGFARRDRSDHPSLAACGSARDEEENPGIVGALARQSVHRYRLGRSRSSVAMRSSACSADARAAATCGFINPVKIKKSPTVPGSTSDRMPLRS